MNNTNVSFDLNRFDLNYSVNGVKIPVYRIIPATQNYPSPFNTKDTPFLLPSNVETFGGQVAATHLDPSGTPVDWRVTMRFFRGVDNSIIWTQGSPSLDHIDVDAGQAPLAPGTTQSVGYTPLNNSKPHLYQPQQFTFTPNDPVRMELTLTTFVPGTTPKTPIIDTDPSNNVLNFWLMIVC